MVIGFDGSRSFIENKTGTENYAYQLLRHLARIDRKNQYIIYLRPGNVVEDWQESELAVQRISEPDNPPIRQSANPLNYGWPENFRFKMLKFPRLWTQIGLAKQTFTDPLDVLFVPSHTLPLIRKPGLKTVMTVHDLGAEYLPGMHQLRQRLYLGLMTKIQLKTAAKLIAVSQATKDDLIAKIGVNPKSITVVYEGVNNIQEDNERNNMIYKDKEMLIKDAEKLSQSIDKIIKLYHNNYFLFVGTIQPRKNLERLIKAYAAFLNVKTNPPIRQSANPLPKLILAGGKGWLSDDLFSLPQKLGIERHVIFTGRVSDAELGALYKNALGFTFPSLFEGFGLPVLEAFAAQIPVVTSNNSSLPEVAGEAALLVNPYKTEEIIDALIKMYNEKDLRSELVKKGEQQLKKFSWQKCAEETLKVLESVVRT